MLNLRAFFIIFVFTGFTALAVFGENALAGGPPPMQGCDINIAKVAPGGDGVEFPFDLTVDGSGPSPFSLLGGQSDGGPFFSAVTVTELPLNGWKLSDIECDSVGATGFEIAENGFTATCDGGGLVTCTFFNERAVSNIPTLPEWGLIAMAGVLGIAALLVIRRRKATA